MDVIKISKMQNKFEEFMKIYARKPAKVVLYGAGKGADWTIDLLETENIIPVVIVDKACADISGGGV